MTDFVKVTVVVTGLGRAGEGASGLIGSVRGDGTFDYNKLERPTLMRKQTNLATKASSPIVSIEQEMDYLDIPAFLRRQEVE